MSRYIKFSRPVNHTRLTGRLSTTLVDDEDFTITEPDDWRDKDRHSHIRDADEIIKYLQDRIEHQR
jgi:hypothetical protein